MRVLLLTALLAVPASAPSAPSASIPLFSAPSVAEPAISLPGLEKPVINPNPRAALGLCPKTAAQIAAERIHRDGAVKLHKLTDLPPANAYLAVFRHDSMGCESPIVVEYGLGRR